MVINKLSLAVILSFFALSLQAANIEHKIGTPFTLTAHVIGITDGDTITVLDANKVQFKIRLAGIDTPEMNQAYGNKAKEILSTKVFNKNVRVKYLNKDMYGRILGDVYLGKRWINKDLVAEGWAWHYKKYSTDKRLAEAEGEARKNRNGIWQDTLIPIPPWEFRLMKRRARNYIK